MKKLIIISIFAFSILSSCKSQKSANCDAYSKTNNTENGKTSN
jgi:hypothetical protein